VSSFSRSFFEPGFDAMTERSSANVAAALPKSRSHAGAGLSVGGCVAFDVVAVGVGVGVDVGRAPEQPVTETARTNATRPTRANA